MYDLKSLDFLPKITIYTDGSCYKNPGPGGWGALLQYNTVYKQIFGYNIVTTNNRMEITAAIKSLQTLKKSCYVDIYTDSKYLQLGITLWIKSWLKNNWRTNCKSSIKNIDLWQDLYKEFNKHYITWHWIKGHNNNKGNDIADKLAVKGKKIAKHILNTTKIIKKY